ncbi:FHA domain-containing protein [Agromyces sp. MMS24-K17]|uniref:FHA domain-containing protein n=1 Tax=Agromyces sp. MMS24-K17 TaxID=3372850 RepID=UPI0037543176
MFEYAPAPIGTKPGFAIVTGRFVTLFGHDTGAEFAGELYALLENEQAELADVLDLLALDGGPPDCGIVEVVDPDARAVHVGVRGAVDVVMDGVASTKFSGPGGGAWVVGEASGIDGLRLAIGEPGGGGDRLPVQRGVVRTTEIAMAQARVSVRRPAEDVSTQPITLPDLPGEAGLVGALAAGEPVDGASSDDGVGAVGSPVREAVRERIEAAAPEPRRVALPVAEAPSAAEPAAVPRATAPATAAPADWIMRLPDGSELRPPVVFGRRLDPGTGNAVHVVTPSPRREISGRHVQVEWDGAGVAAVDLGSTNGTIVRSGARAPRLLIHSERIVLSAGDILDLGESYLVTVEVAGGPR